ncbi:hypothetical protein [Streptomyces luteogriseus]
MSTPTPTPELVADVIAIVRQPYRAGVLLAYAHRDGGRHIPTETAGGAA